MRYKLMGEERNFVATANHCTNQTSEFALGFSHDFYPTEMVRGCTYAGTYDLTGKPRVRS